MGPDAADASRLPANQRYQAAQQLHQQGRLEDAERHYHAVLLTLPGHPGALHGLGVVCLQRGRLDEAADILTRASAAAPEDTSIRYHLGHVLNLLGRNEEALICLERSVAIDPGRAETYTNLGNVLVALKRPEDALVSFSKTIALNPRLPEPYNNGGSVLSSLGRHEEAVTQFEKALALKPDFVSALNNLGNALAKLGQHEEAIVHFERALSIQPGLAVGRYNLGSTLAALGRHEDAVVQFEKVLALRPGYAAAFNSLGDSLKALGRPAQALIAFEQALSFHPGFAAAHVGAGSALQELGRIEEARAAYERGVALAPHIPSYHRVLAETRHYSEGDPQIAVLEDLARNETALPDKERVELYFALAKVHADLQDHARSFAYLEKGNALKRAFVAYDEKAELGAMADIASVFTQDAMETMRGSGDPSDLPVFVLGMPRSGTSLIEQMLSSHPLVFGAGELPNFGEVFAGGYAPAHLASGISSISRESLHRSGVRYAARIRALSPDAARIVDKLPNNFLYAGPIHLALPKARIVHVRRDPADTCFSCYSKLFTGNLNHTYDLGELGRYYKAYAALMAHWRGVLPEGAMLEVRYKALVEDFETEARRIVAFCGLEWDERCLAFHKTERAVRTASAFQVRQPLFRSSIGRWRPYEEWLRPLTNALR